LAHSNQAPLNFSFISVMHIFGSWAWWEERHLSI